MDETPQDPRVMDFFRAMIDEDRLKIAGLLALEPRSINEIAKIINLKPSQALKHVDQLKHIDLVRSEGEKYTLDTGSLENLAREVLSGLTPQVRPEDFEGSDFERKVLSDFIQPDGRLKAIPTQEKKLLVVLEHIAQEFEPGERYSEKLVNVMLHPFHPDTALLRRYLVDYGFLERQGGGGEYWRAD